MRDQTIVEQSKLFKNKIKKLKTKFPRIDDSVRGLIWALERCPEKGEVLGEPLGSHRLLDIGPPGDGFPGLWIGYAINGNKVILEDIINY